MTRYLYGRRAADFTYSGGVIVAGATLQVYDAYTGGTHITDLLTEAGAGTTSVTSGSDGRIAFQGPDGIASTLYLDSGVGARYPVEPVSIASTVSANGTLLAALQAVTDTTFREALQDYLGTVFTGSGVSYNDVANTFTFSGSGSGSTVDKFTVGIATTQAAIGNNVVPGGQLVDSATTVTTVYLHADTAPTGSALTVTATDSAGRLYFTQSIAAGNTDQTTAAVTATQIPAGTRLIFNVTSAGSTTAAIGVVLDMVCDSSVTGVPATLGGLTVENWTGSSLPSGWTASGNLTGVLDGSGHLTFPWVNAGASGGQDQFSSTIAKVLRTVTYNSDGNMLSQKVIAPIPNADGRQIGLYCDMGSGASSSGTRWLYAYTEHYTPTSATLYHKLAFWNGTTVLTSGPSVASSNTVYDTPGLYQRLRRTGTVIYFDTSTDGSTWTNVCSIDMSTNAPSGGFTRAGVGSGFDSTKASWTGTVDWTAYA